MTSLKGLHFLSGATVVCALLAVGPSGAADPETALLDIDVKSFNRSTVIDNQWMPLKPGTQLVFDGFTREDGETVAHSIVFTVTDQIKVINGIPSVVVLDRDYSDGQMIEEELTFFAQDDQGNVWHLGQLRETNDESELVGGRAWMVGHLEGAKAGIMMPAKPTLGEASYSEGYAPPPFNWTDRARVVKLDEKTTVPVGSYENVLVIEEFDAENPGAFQLKYYAPGVGNVRVGWRGDDSSIEEMELVKITTLTGDDLAKARNAALKLEERAYIYGKTEPMYARPTQ